MLGNNRFMPGNELFSPSRFVSEGIWEANGLPYRAVAEDFVFYDKEGKAQASIFSYSYFLKGTENAASRPVLFAFNGGPGSSSLMLHAGFLGVKRAFYGGEPYGRERTGAPISNPDSLLPEADLVLVDPVGTGFGRLIEPNCSMNYFGIRQDAETCLAFVSNWLTRYHRWQSPKYLLGESYGSTRAAMMAGIASGGGAEETYTLDFDGIILIGNTISPSSYEKKDLPIEPSVLHFSSFAATHWYHKEGEKPSLEAFIREADAFAEEEYLKALYLGNNCTGVFRHRIKERISYYTGVSGEYLESVGLRISNVEFLRECLKQKGQEVSIYDSRCAVSRQIGSEQEKKDPFKDDPVLNRYEPRYREILETEIVPAFGITFERRFRGSFLGVQQIWDYSLGEKNTAEQLSAAMRRNPQMRVFFMNGYYDLCTQGGLVRYTLRHGAFPAERTFFKEYPSGHMLYIGETCCHEAAEDIRRFIRQE